MRKEYRKQKAKAKFYNYIQRTWKYKVCGLAVLIGGVLGVVYLNDARALVFSSLFAVPLFFRDKIELYY